MTNEEQLLAALEYQRAMRPAFGNPNLMRQGQRMNLPARQAPGLFSEFGTQAMSLNPQPDQGYGTMAAEMALGFVPGVGQAMAARDIERARRDNDPLGMALAGLSLLPLGKLIGAMRGGKQIGPVSELDVYHGSPHRFPPTANNPLGEFDPTKIGTGEGAQVYGVGAGYLAEAKGLAASYRDTLAHKGALDLEYEAGKRGIPLNREAQVEFMRQSIPNVSPEKAARSFQNANIEARNLDQNKLTALFKDYKESKQGHLYKVDLPDEQIAKMLDWDKPLSQQSWYRPVADVVKEYKGAGKDIDAYARLISKANARGGEITGGQLYEGMLSQFGGSQAKVSEFMREAGIPGIRYLDQGSRHLSNWEVGKANPEGTKWVLKNKEMAPSLWKTFDTKAEADAALKIADPMAGGTRNFVVFDPAHMNIIERDGLTLEQALASRQDVRDIMKPTVPESSLMYRDPFGGIE